MQSYEKMREMQKENCFSFHFRVQSKFGEAKCTKIIRYLIKKIKKFGTLQKNVYLSRKISEHREHL
jgi:hypothetical protein